MDRILIADLTRMRHGRLCVASLTEQLDCVRLDVGYPGIEKPHLYKDKQVIIRPRAVVRTQVAPNFQCKAPHLEDHFWIDPETTIFEYLVGDERWHEVLTRTKFPSVADVFGIPLISNRKVEPWQGERSLGTVESKAISRVHYDEHPYEENSHRLRIDFRDESEECFAYIPVVDLAAFNYASYLHHVKDMPLEDVAAFLKQKFRAADEIWLRVGLTRPWQDESGEVYSYIQVAGIHTFPDYLRGACFADFEVT